MQGFRPHEGDPSSLQQYGPFSENTGQFVSVPTKGTHLLYQANRTKGKLDRGFRPHEGDPSSLLLIEKGYVFRQGKFPSPRRGPIFSTPTGTRTTQQRLLFPSPRRGPIFSTYKIKAEKLTLGCFRPHEGDPSSLQKQGGYII